MFFPRATIILFQVAKKLEKRNGEIVLYYYFAFNRQAVHIENESWKSIKWRSTRLSFKSKTSSFLLKLWNVTNFLHIKVQYKCFSFIINVLLAISKKCWKKYKGIPLITVSLAPDYLHFILEHTQSCLVIKKSLLCPPVRGL